MKTTVLAGFAVGQIILWAVGIQTPKESALVVIQVAPALGVLHFASAVRS